MGLLTEINELVVEQLHDEEFSESIELFYLEHTIITENEQPSIQWASPQYKKPEGDMSRFSKDTGAGVQARKAAEKKPVTGDAVMVLLSNGKKFTGLLNIDGPTARIVDHKTGQVVKSVRVNDLEGGQESTNPKHTRHNALKALKRPTEGVPDNKMKFFTYNEERNKSLYSRMQ